MDTLIIQSQYVHYLVIALAYSTTLSSVYVKLSVARKVLAVSSGVLLLSNVVILRSDIDLVSVLLIVPLLLIGFIGVFSAYFAAFEPAYLIHQHWRNYKQAIFVLGIFALLSFAHQSTTLTPFIAQLSSALVLATVTFALYMYGNHRLMSWKTPPGITLDQKHPSVSLCIPARNETHALTRSLQKAVASTYDKLEILVVDDCSHDKTEQIIRSFAHDGVRFIKGSPPEEDWLGKNNAYAALADEASGDYLVFAGTDIELQPESIERVIAHMQHYKLSMVSVLPQRNNPDVLSAIIQPLRYFFLLIHPLQTTPVLSSFWVIQKSALEKHGSFGAVKAALFPEKYFAEQLKDSGTYAFVASAPRFGIATRKRISSLYETSIRLHYPSFRRSWVVSVLYAWVFALVGITPYILLFTFSLVSVLGLLCMTAIVLQALLFAQLTRKTNPTLWLVVLITLPYKILQEAILLMVSALLYEINAVTWKQRNVCEPVTK